MAQQIIDIGSTANDGTGDPIRDAFDKTNDNFSELYASDALKAPLASPTFTGTPAAPTASPGANTTQIATTAFVKAAVDLAVTGLLDLKGSTDCSSNPNYPSASKGDTYLVSVAGKIGGASGKSVEVGDVYIASADNAGGTEGSVGTSWFVIEHNIAGALVASNNLSDLTNAATARINLNVPRVIATHTFNGSESSYDTGTLPVGFSAYEIDIISRSSKAGTNADASKLRFNGDTGANYTFQNLTGNTTTAAASSTAGATSITITTTAATATANLPGAARIIIPHPENTTFFKSLFIHIMRNNGNPFINCEGAVWANTGAITSIQISSESGDNYVSGSIVVVRGIP